MLHQTVELIQLQRKYANTPGCTFVVPEENAVLSRKTDLEKESTLPLQCVYRENAKRTKVRAANLLRGRKDESL